MKKTQQKSTTLFDKLISAESKALIKNKTIESPVKQQIARPQTAPPKKAANADQKKQEKAVERVGVHSPSVIETQPSARDDASTKQYPVSPMKQAHDQTMKDLRAKGASAEEIEEFKRNEMIVKSVQYIKEHSQQMEERRTSPERFRETGSKVTTINPYSKLLSQPTMHTKTLNSTYAASPMKNFNKTRENSPMRTLDEMGYVSPQKYLPNYTEKNSKDFIPMTAERIWPLFGFRLAEHEKKIGDQTQLLEELRATIESARSTRTQVYAARRDAHQRSDEQSKRVIAAKREPLKQTELKAPVFEQIKVPEYKPMAIAEFKPVVPVKSADPAKVQKIQKYQPQPIEQNKYYNPSLDENLALMKDEQRIAAEELEVVRSGIDRAIFYDLLQDWDYGGLKPYDQAASQQALVPLKKLQDRQGLKMRDDGGAIFYTVGKDAYYVQNKPVSYKMFDKKPLEFYDTMMTQEMLMIKAHGQPLKKGQSEPEVTFNEFTQKRHIGQRYDAWNAAQEAANKKKAENIMADKNVSDSLKSSINVYFNKRQQDVSPPRRQQKVRSMAEQMRLVIFYKVLIKRLDEIKQFDRQALTEIAKLNNPPQMVIDLCSAVAGILNHQGEQTWAEYLKLINPQNFRLFTQINVVDVHKESLLPYRNFAARVRLSDVMAKNKAAAMLYLWAHMVDEAYQMTNKEEFAAVQEMKMLFAAQAPSTKLRTKFGQGSYYKEINDSRATNAGQPSDEKIRDINLSEIRETRSAMQSQMDMELSMKNDIESRDFGHQGDSQAEIQFSIRDDELRTSSAPDHNVQTASFKASAADDKHERIAKAQAGVHAIREEIQGEMDAAMSLYHVGLKDIQIKALQELKSMASPPAAVKTVMDGVMFVLGHEQNWAEAKKQIANTSTFIDKILKFDLNKVTPKMFEGLRQFTNKPELAQDALKKISVAACSLAIWLHALQKFGEVKKATKSKRNQLMQAEAELAKLQK